MLKSRREIGENCEKRSERVGSQADISATKGPIDMRQTRMRREMQGLAYVVSLDKRRVTRAVLPAPSVKICVFFDVFHDSSWCSKCIRRRDV